MKIMKIIMKNMKNMKNIRKGTNMSKRTSFVLYHSQREMMKYLNEAELASLLLAIYDFSIKGEYTEPVGNARIAFEAIRAQMEIDSAKYKETCERNRQNIEKRWEKEEKPPSEKAKKKGVESKSKPKKEESDTTVYFRIPYDADADADTDTDTDTDADADAGAGADADAEAEAEAEAEADAPVEKSGMAEKSGADAEKGRGTVDNSPADAEKARVVVDNSPADAENARAERHAAYVARVIRTGFEDFWERYPKKMRKDQARRVFHRYMDGHPERLLPLETALEHAIDRDYRFGEARFVPLPENWLAEEPWNDVRDPLDSCYVGGGCAWGER